MLTKGKQFLLLIRHLSCYSYIQSSPVKILAVIEERKVKKSIKYLTSKYTMGSVQYIRDVQKV